MVLFEKSEVLYNISENTTSLKCVRTYILNSTKRYYIHEGFSGIPETLGINFWLWLLLTILFFILRRIFIYVHPPNWDDSWGCTKKFYFQFLSWLPRLFTVTDEQIVARVGHDAKIYLSFQRYIIGLLFAVMVYSMGIVLPINYQGSYVSDFAQTTIANVDARSSYMWVHVFGETFYVVLTILLMARFRRRYLNPMREITSGRTLIITNIPTSYVSKVELSEYFHYKFPDVPILSINFAYNVKQMNLVAYNREWYGEVKDEAMNNFDVKNYQEEMLTIPCGRLLFHCSRCSTCCCEKEDARNYYHDVLTEEVCRFDQLIDTCIENPLDIVFVAFYSESKARQVYQYFNPLWIPKCCWCPDILPTGEKLTPKRWRVDFAPQPGDVYWDNLGQFRWVWWLKCLILNLLVILFLLVFTTPSMLLNLLDEMRYRRHLHQLNSPILVNVLPVILLSAFASLLPIIIYYLEWFTGHWSRVVEQRMIMIKTFALVLLMVLILPSIGLTSAFALLRWLGQVDDPNTKMRWECVFLPDNGAFFVNYIITIGFTSNAVQLLRIPSLLLLSIRLLLAKSKAERIVVRRKSLINFEFGSQYAWICVMVAVILAYSLTCPLITPFGIVFIMIRHVVDKHNLLYTTLESQAISGPHHRAISFVYAGIILSQIFLVVFIRIRTSSTPPTVVFAIIVLTCSLLYLAGDTLYQWLRNKLAIIACCLFPTESDTGSSTEDSSDVPLADRFPYIPDVLANEIPRMSLVQRFPRAKDEPVARQSSTGSVHLVKEPSDAIEMT